MCCARRTFYVPAAGHVPDGQVNHPDFRTEFRVIGQAFRPKSAWCTRGLELCFTIRGQPAEHVHDHMGVPSLGRLCMSELSVRFIGQGRVLEWVPDVSLFLHLNDG